MTERIELTPEQFEQVQKALNAPPKDVPGLRRLLNHPTVFDQES